jgi:hypothetical protein
MDLSLSLNLCVVTLLLRLCIFFFLPFCLSLLLCHTFSQPLSSLAIYPSPVLFPYHSLCFCLCVLFCLSIPSCASVSLSLSRFLCTLFLFLHSASLSPLFFASLCFSVSLCLCLSFSLFLCVSVILCLSVNIFLPVLTSFCLSFCPFFFASFCLYASL